MVDALKGTRFEKVIIKGEEAKGPQPIVTFGAGLIYTELIEEVDRAGYALMQLPALPHINVVGSMIMGTHGSGYQIMTMNVLTFDLVTPDGTLMTISYDKTPGFKHYLLNFGGLGIITSMTMKVFERFNVFKSIYTDLPFKTLFENLDKMTGKYEYLSFFATW